MSSETKFEEIERTLPAYWAPYLINGDASGMEDSDIALCDAYIERLGWGYPADCGDEQWFAWRNDVANIGCDVMVFTFMRSL